MNINGYELYARMIEHYTVKAQTTKKPFEFVSNYNNTHNKFVVMTRNTKNELVFVKFTPDETFIFDNFKEGNSSVETIVDLIGVLA